MPSPAVTRAAGCRADCNGCAHRALSARASETQKLNWLTSALAPWRECLAPIRVVSGTRRWAYRDRVTLTAQWVIDGDACGEWRIGLMRRDEVIDIRDCPVHSVRVQKALAALLRVLPAAAHFPLAFYVQAGAQITLVLKTATPPDNAWFNADTVQALQRAGVEGLWLQLFPSAGKRLFHKNGWRLLWGVPYSTDEAGMRYGPSAFQQLIPALYAQSLDAARAFLAPDAHARVVDLYCGSGRTLRCWQQAGARVLGVEIGAEAVACAAHNAPGVPVLRGPCAQRLPQVREWVAAPGERLLYVNPPRSGLEPAVLDWICEDYRPQRMAYLSCSTGTLSRDLQRLCVAGYRVERLQPYDFFPQTWHVECLAMLRREA